MDKLTTKIRNLNLNKRDDEYSELKKAYEMFKNPVRIEIHVYKGIINNSIERYLRYLKNINNWMEFTDIKMDIKKFLYEKDIIKKSDMMISIDRRLYEIVTKFRTECNLLCS